MRASIVQKKLMICTVLSNYDPEEAAEDGIGCAHCEDHSCEDDYD